MAKYVTLKKEIYESVRSQPFTSIPTRPTWAHEELLNPFLTSETLFFGDGVINGTYPNFTPSFAAA